MPTVLVVEDDYDFRELQRFMLQSSGYRVITAGNGVEALAVLDVERPCVILLDLMMPIMDGVTFLRERRAHGVADAPVICVSAGGSELSAQAVREGAVHCIPKPADLGELCDAVERFCPPAG